MVSVSQEQAWKNTQLHKQKSLGQGSLIKNPVIRVIPCYPTIYTAVTVLLVCKSTEMLSDIGSESLDKKRFIMPLNKEVRRFVKYNLGKQSEHKVHNTGVNCIFG